MTQSQYVWSSEDWQTGVCRIDQIGTPKPTSTIAPPESMELTRQVLDALPPATMAEFKQAALRVARGKMGYDAFFEKYPSFHHKLLLAMTRESTPPLPTHVNVNLSWISPNRLSYKRDSPPPLDVIENEPEK